MARGTASGRARPTLHSVAAEAGVSHQTVSNVLNAPHKVRPSTRDRVLEVIRTLDYRPNETARSLAHRRTRLVSFHVGREGFDGVAMLNAFARDLARAGRAHGYRVVLDVAEGDDDEQIRSFEDLHARRAVDGVVISSTHPGDKRPTWLVDHGLPMVAFGRPWHDPAPRHAWVDVDGRLGIRAAVEHLQQAGHTAVAFVGPAPDGGMEDDRLGGLVDAVTATGATFDPRSALVAPEPGHLWDALPAFMRARRPTALVCRDDAYAFEALQVLRSEHGTDGVDIAVTGFDDSPLARRARPAITSVAQPVEQVADLIWSTLVDQIDGRATTPVQHLIAPTLVPRESSRPRGASSPAS